MVLWEETKENPGSWSTFLPPAQERWHSQIRLEPPELNIGVTNLRGETTSTNENGDRLVSAFTSLLGMS